MTKVQNLYSGIENKIDEITQKLIYIMDNCKDKIVSTIPGKVEIPELNIVITAQYEDGKTVVISSLVKKRSSRREFFREKNILKTSSEELYDKTIYTSKVKMLEPRHIELEELLDKLDGVCR